jgi:hypothetical protein
MKSCVQSFNDTPSPIKSLRKPSSFSGLHREIMLLRKKQLRLMIAGDRVNLRAGVMCMCNQATWTKKPIQTYSHSFQKSHLFSISRILVTKYSMPIFYMNIYMFQYKSLEGKLNDLHARGVTFKPAKHADIITYLHKIPSCMCVRNKTKIFRESLKN